MAESACVIRAEKGIYDSAADSWCQPPRGEWSWNANHGATVSESQLKESGEIGAKQHATARERAASGDWQETGKWGGCPSSHHHATRVASPIVALSKDNKIKVPMTLRKHWWRFVLLIAAVIIGTWAYVLVAVRGTFASFQSANDARGEAVVAGVAGHRIAGRVYLDETPASAAPLVVVLHGDAPFINPGYQYAVAADLANAAPGVRVVALMRPGYADVYGSRSDGDRGFASGENYTLSVANDLAAAIQSLKQRWGAPSIILVGHSGGAAVAANIAALFPGLVQHLFLVACPCDVPAFRQHMARLHWSPMWLLPADSLSPIQTLDRMSSETKITAISGANDPIALVEYSEQYIAKARTLGIAASMIVLPDKGHEILDDTAVVALVSRAARDGN